MIRPYTLITFLVLTVSSSYAQVKGSVFRDFNNDGIYSSTFPNIDAPAQGVIVNAYNSANTLIASYTSADNGDFIIPTIGTYNGTVGSNTGGIPAGTAVRLEFILPTISAMPHEAQKGIDFSSAGARNHGSAVQFVTAPNSSIHYAINCPKDYTGDNNPYLITSKFINGTYNNPISSTYNSIYTFKYNSTGNPNGIENPPTAKAKVLQTGSLWGMAINQRTKTVYSAALLRRYAGFGPLGIGGIYKTDVSNPTALSGAAPYIDVKTIGIPAGTDPRSAGSCDTLATNPRWPAHDSTAAAQVGKVGLADIEYDDRRNTLWLINLNDRKLYGIKNVSNTTAPTAADVVGGYTVTLPTGYTFLHGVLRPWAVKEYRGKLYIGAVATGELYANVWQNQLLKGYVLRFDPDNPSAGFAMVKEFGFDYRRASYWGTVYENAWSNWANAALYKVDEYNTPEPIVSDIEFDVDGSLIVGIAPRQGFQKGGFNYSAANCSSTDMSDGASEGDVLRFCINGNTYITAANTNNCSTPIPPALQCYFDHDWDAATPGFPLYEYYWGEYGPAKNTNSTFNETALGATILIPGTNQLVSTAIDVENWNSNGVITLNNTTGGDVNRYNLYRDFHNGLEATIGMSKSVGIGDLEYIAELPPIEIGNRVWQDGNYNGIQDATELGKAGVEIELVNTSGTVLATVVTDANGNYYFSSAVGTNTVGIHYNTAILPFTNYIIRVKGNVNGSNSINGNAGLTPADLLSLPNMTGNGEADWSDNDGEKIGGRYQSTITTGDYGHNDHSIDFAFGTLNILPANSLQLIAAKNDNYTDIQFTVKDASTSVVYTLQRSTNNVNYNNLQNWTNTNAVAFNYKDATVSQNSIYYYRVQVADANGKVAYSQTQKVIYGAGINVDVYPVPASNNISINIASSVQHTVERIDVYNIAGGKIMTVPTTNSNGITQLDISNLVTGTYQLRVIDRKGVIVANKKITVIK
jgi:hypothetical protein